MEKQQKQNMFNNRAITVVIPTLNRPENIKELLTSILTQTFLPKEVVVIDGSDTQLTENLISNSRPDFSKLKIGVIYQRENGITGRGICGARNQGMSIARGEIISFIDDDVVLARNYFEKILEVFNENPQVVGVQGYGNSPGFSLLNNVIGKVFGLFYAEEGKSRVLPSGGLTFPYSLQEVSECDWLSGTNSSYKKKACERFRWDEHLGEYSLYDDVDLSYRISKFYPHSLFMTPAARFVHNHSSTARRNLKLDTYIRVSFTTYFFFKDKEQTFLNRSAFVWSMVANFFVLFIWRKKIIQIWHSLSAYFFLLRNFKKIVKGEFRFLDWRNRRA